IGSKSSTQCGASPTLAVGPGHQNVGAARRGHHAPPEPRFSHPASPACDSASDGTTYERLAHRPRLCQARSGPREAQMANPYTVNVAMTPPSAGGAVSIPPPSRYRHPGDVIRLIIGGVVLVTLLIVAIVAPDRTLGRRATTVTGLGPGTAAGRLLV